MRGPSLLLLDDVLCAVDAITEEACHQACFAPDGLLRDTTVILASNDIKRWRDAHHLLYMSKGTIVAQGSYAFLSESQTGFKALASASTIRRTKLEVEEAVHVKEETSSPQSAIDLISEEAHENFDKSPISAVITYAKACGKANLWGLFITAIIAWPTFNVGFSTFIAVGWARDNPQKDWMVGILVLITVVYLISAAIWWCYDLVWSSR